MFSQLILVGVCLLFQSRSSATTSKEDLSSLEQSLESTCSSSVGSSGSADRVFEGVEKRIEIRFHVKAENESGLRAIAKKDLDIICDASKCTIIHSEPDTCFESYILSESSLFVFRDRIMMKTCGTTLPLNGVDRILAAANSLNLKPIDMTYSRSSFVFPGRQPFPHDSLDSERKYLTDMSARLGHEISDRTEVLGDENGIFWLIHTKIFASEFVPEPEPRIMVDCIMTGLAADARAAFWKDSTYCDEKNLEAMSAVIQPFDETFRVVGIAFDPCGFSANVHGGTNGDYMSVHVTPEEGFSYASVEGVFGGHFDSVKISTFVQRVVNVFRPDKLLVTVLTNTEEFSSFGSVQPDPASPNYQLENLGSARLQGVHASAALYQRRK